MSTLFFIGKPINLLILCKGLIEMKEYHGKYASNSKSRAKIYEQFALKTHKEFCLKSRLEQAAKQNNMSITA